MGRVVANGRHLSVDGSPFRVKGVTYGSFARRLDGFQFPEPAAIKTDLVEIARAGLNTLRTYTLPPSELVEIAGELDLRVMVGLHYDDWRTEPHTGRGAARRILEAGRRAVHQAMEEFAHEPAVMAVAVGNEVPVDLVRLHGVSSVENVLSELVREVHEADPEMLATYVSFPTTEFLEVGGQDLACFNVFLEEPEQLRRYLAHLQVVSDDLPLVVTELGLAGGVHGEDAQAESLRWQLRAVDEAGCSGATIFSWTDEWAVDDEPVTGWDFGIVTEDRQPKKALAVAAEWATGHISDLRDDWPAISVVVCAYNEEATIAECLASLAACEYPDLQVVVCDDGSTDRTLEIIREFPFEILELPHGGLSRARNAGLEAATGQIVAYLDADAACHPEWPFHLALSMEDDSVVATGGPNLPHPDAAFVERAVALSPGSPSEVLLTADRAEHVPGCNMAFRKTQLEAIGGFDPVYTTAGDDVDVCWKLIDEGHEIGFAPAAQVVHHRRNTVKGYLKQQRGYGRAEKLLSGPHRHRFNTLGQARWSGFVYGGSRILPSLFRPVIYTGYMGMAPFQPIVQRRAELLGASATALLPFAVPAALLGVLLSPFSLWWLTVPAILTVLTVAYGLAVATALRVDRREPHPWRLRSLVGLLHVLQPVVRAWGRITGKQAALPEMPSPEWAGDRFAWLENLSRSLEAEGLTTKVAPSGEHWDLRVDGGPMVSARITTAVVWRWEPRYRVSYRPRSAFWGLVGIGLITLFFSTGYGLAILGAGLVWGAAATVSLRRRVRRGIFDTTEASKT